MCSCSLVQDSVILGYSCSVHAMHVCTPYIKLPYLQVTDSLQRLREQNYENIEKEQHTERETFGQRRNTSVVDP
jgi:hypothetical protein